MANSASVDDYAPVDMYEVFKLCEKLTLLLSASIIGSAMYADILRLWEFIGTCSDVSLSFYVSPSPTEC